ncbi:hypothetical protein J6590_087120 [Homalodisca vitripennis]|nr:hypothetical protein J6590_087120 [Homalodisca vitripennis]
MFMSAPCYIATFPFLGEYVPTQDRFRSVMIATACSILGLAYSTLVAWATLLGQWEADLWLVKFTPWRLFFLICGVPALISAILFCITPESPKFLLTRGKKEETLQILQKVYSINSGKECNTYPLILIEMPYSIQLTDYAAGDSLNDLDVLC